MFVQSHENIHSWMIFHDLFRPEIPGHRGSAHGVMGELGMEPHAVDSSGVDAAFDWDNIPPTVR